MSELYFSPGGIKGFTSKELADKRTGFAVPIRELLQNSLDAAAVNELCQVDIYIKTVAKENIPHIREYEAVLEKAIRTLREKESYNQNSQQVVSFIKEALSKNELDVLMFVDNGMGMKQEVLEGLLDERSMHADESSGGSYGVGHLSSYFLSSLRYVLYATKYGNGEPLFTGSPILAGHSDGEADRGGIGRIVEEKPDSELKPEYKFPTTFPPFIRSKMDKLQSTGSMVAILGLSEEWSSEAEYAIVSNFFHAMLHTNLKVSIHCKEQETKTINDDEVRRLIALKKEKTRARGDDILSGQAVDQAYQAVQGGKLVQLELGNGDKVYVCLKNDIDSRSGIVLIRNGMVIARHDSMLSGDMEHLRQSDDYETFMAVIDVDKTNSPQLFELVKGAEGPYHNKLEKGRLVGEREKELRDLFKELGEALKRHLKKISREGFDLPLFDMPSQAEIQAGANPRNTSGQSTKTRTRRKEVIPQPVPGPDPRKKRKKRPKPEINPRRLASKNAMRYYSRQGPTLEVAMEVTPTQQPDAKDSIYLSIALAEDNDRGTVKEFAEFVNLSINGKEILKTTDSKVNQVKLGKLSQEEPCKIIAKIESPPGFENTEIALEPIFSLKQDKKSKDE